MRRVSLPRFFGICVTLSALAVSAASAAAQNRLSAAIAGNTRATLPNSVHGSVRLATDLGPAAANLKLEGMTLRFNLTGAQQAALDQLLLDQQNPASPLYHQWLTPAQYAAQFGLSRTDIAKVTAWLTSQGFTITEVANSGTFVRFDGTAAQVQSAFATSIHTLSLHGETHFANITDPALPSTLAGVVSAVTGLHDFKLKSRLRTQVVDGSGLTPKFTSSTTGSHYIAPGDFYTIYNETPLFNNAINGTGQTIAVMGQIDISLTDIAAFRNASGLSTNNPVIKTYGTDPGGVCSGTNCSPNALDLGESTLDVEWSGAAAPGATIIFVNSTNVIFTSLTDAIDNNLAPIISISYGSCEVAWGTSELNSLNQLLKQANAFGITVVAPSGDDGATDCDSGETVAIDGLTVDFPGSSPYATSMGGTMFNDGIGNFWSTTESSVTAGTLVTAATESALSYIPEAAWNEDIAGSTFSAGGGGVSNFFSKPAWQKGTGVPNDASRDVPDLALNSAANHDGYLYCVQSSCVTGFRTANGGLAIAGGTSFAAPIFAGILAVVEQKVGSRLANANPTIYALANNTTFNNATSLSAFHDIVTGNNDSPCLAGTPNCSGAQIGYSAGSGYDLATGWGSVNVYNLATDWNLVTAFGLGSNGPNISATTASVSSSSVVAGATVTLSASVTGTAGPIPTGTVQFLVNNTAVGAPVTLTGTATASYSYVTSCSTLGQQVVAAAYSGDTTYAGSKAAGITAQGFTSQFSTASAIEIQVSSGTCPDFTLTAPAPPTVTTGSPSVLLTVTPANGFVGSIVFSATAVETSSTAPTFFFSSNPISITSTTTTATTTLTLNNIIASLHAPTVPGRPDSRTPWYAAGSGITIASLLLFTLPRRRRLGGLLLVALSIALIGGATGCGAKNTTVAAGSANTEAGTYAVTVTATYTPTSGSVTAHSTLVQFTVQ